MTNEIKLVNICKSFGEKIVFEDLNLTIKTGRIIGLIGENGIGKTTLLRLIGGMSNPSAGSIAFDTTYHGKEDLKNVVYMAEPAWFESWMKVKDIINFYNDCFVDFDKEEVKRYCDEMEIGLNDKFINLSKGEQEKVCLLVSFARHGYIYLLDEPANGFDPKIKKEIIRIILKLSGGSKTIIIATHLLKDFENIFDDVLLLKHNEIILMSSETIREEKRMSVEEFFLEEGMSNA